MDDRGSALLLVPAAVLALLVLGALALDSLVVFTAQRQLADAAAAAANDAAVRGVDAITFQDCGVVRLNPAAVRASVDATLATRLTDLASPRSTVDIGESGGRPAVTVHVEGEAAGILAPSVGGVGVTRVYASATGVAVATGVAGAGDGC